MYGHMYLVYAFHLWTLTYTLLYGHNTIVYGHLQDLHTHSNPIVYGHNLGLSCMATHLHLHSLLWTHTQPFLYGHTLSNSILYGHILF